MFSLLTLVTRRKKFLNKANGILQKRKTERIKSVYLDEKHIRNILYLNHPHTVFSFSHAFRLYGKKGSANPLVILKERCCTFKRHYIPQAFRLLRKKIVCIFFPTPQFFFLSDLKACALTPVHVHLHQNKTLRLCTYIGLIIASILN